jgi:hypothetical protein
MFLIFYLLLAIVNIGSTPIVDRVDMVELNHRYGLDGQFMFDQVIWYDWNQEEERFDIVDFRVISNSEAEPLPKGRVWVSDWMDEGRYLSSKMTWRQVIASSYKETWTQYDPEQDQGWVLPDYYRRRLRRRGAE